MQRKSWMAAAVALLGFACASTRVAQSWKAPDYAGGKLQKVLVVGMTADTALRGIFEDDMVQLLSARGVGRCDEYVA